MNLKLLLTIFMVTTFFSTIKAEEFLVISPINGDALACTGEVYSYNVTNDPTVFYEWSIVNGAFVSSPIGSNSVSVAWYGTGSISVSTYSDPGLTSLIASSPPFSVSVDVLDPYITVDPSVGCLDEKGKQDTKFNFNPEKEENDCLKACEDNPIVYTANGSLGSTYEWEIIGDATPNTATGPTVSVVWHSVGFGVVKLIEKSTNDCIEETEICVEVIAKPDADFNVVPGLTVCVGQTVYFEDMSLAIGDSDLTAWEWQVSDGTFQSYTESTDFSHVFTSGGYASVNLRVYNDCGCYDDYKVEIFVIEEPGPDIFCPKVVCPGEKTVLSTSSGCGTYNWAVTNGTIVSGLGTSSITVMWDDEPSGVGYAYLSTPCGACNVPTVLEIPILSTNLDLIGPLEACVGDQVTISAPMIPGTFYNWSISSSPTSGFIVQTINNQVIIEVTGSNPINVEVNYYSEIAGCGDGCQGTSNHTLVGKDPSQVFGVEEVCVGDTESYIIFGPATGNIQIDKPDGTVASIPSGGSYNFALGGLYVLTPSNAGCQGPPLLVNAFDIPPVADFISGETDVCPGMPYEYTAGNDVDGTIYAWTVNGGSPGTGVGKEITVKWDLSGTYSLEVRRINIKTPNCESDPITLDVDKLIVSPNIIGPNPAVVCANNTSAFSLDYTDGEEYKWTINGEGQGSVISDPNNSSITVLWNNTTGFATVAGFVRKCNEWFADSMVVAISPIVPVSFTASSTTICQNQSVTFNATSGYTYEWAISPAFGSPLPTSSSFTRIFPNAGTFNVTLVATDACGNVTQDSKIITVLPEPPSQLSISASTLVCNNAGVVVSGSATLVTSIIGGTAGHNFAWTYNSSPYGGNTPTVTAFNTGTYQVTVTSIATGCTAVETIKIKCPSGPPCSMPQANTGTFNFSYDNTTCGEVEFNQTSINSAPGWTFTGGTFKHSGVNAFNAPGPSFTYSSFNDAGYYNVAYEMCFSGFGSSCCKTVTQNVPIPVVAEAEASAFCNGSGAYMIQLDDFSSKLGNLANYTSTWIINGTPQTPIFGPSGTTTIPIGGLLPGATYPVILQVSVPMGGVPGMPSAYQCEIATTLEIPALPDASFTAITPVCEDLDIEFTAVANPNSTYTWGFGDGSGLIQTIATASRKYDGMQVGGYNVTLTVTNAAGCTDQGFGNVNVVLNDFDTPVIDVSPTLPICKPMPATLTFNHSGGATATSWAWSDGAVGNPNVVFEAGGYTVTATDGPGCVAVSALTPVDIRPSPSAVIFGESSYCVQSDLPVELFGYAGPGLTYQWRKKPSGGGWFVYSFAANISDTNVSVGGSPYEYELTVTDPATGCSAITVQTVDILPSPPSPIVTQTVANCDPYTVQLDATTSVSPAYFNWSNSDIGTPIDVLHGGLYEVTLTDGNGCSSTKLFEVEGEPNLDFFPVGCYVYCREDLPFYYAGPYGFFDSWELQRNGSTVQAGTGSISNLAITNDGEYTLVVNDNGCIFTSGVMEVTFDEKKCDMQCDKPCDVKLGKIYPEHIVDCMYEFSADIYLGECTNIVDYKWTIDGVSVPGGATMTHVFAGAGGGYNICLVVIAEDDNGNKCKAKVCIDFSPTCKCDCDVEADFDIFQSNCSFKFISDVTASKCTEVYKYVWTLSSKGDIFYTASKKNLKYTFKSQEPVEVCLTVYGFDGQEYCEDEICKIIYPCNQNSDSKRDSKSELDEPTVSISPNPVTNNIRIQSEGAIGTEWHIVVIDVRGRMISNNTVNVKEPFLIMSTDSWRSGMYQIAISDELGNTFVQKIVKVD